MKLYVIGSLRNPNVLNVSKALRELDHEVFDDWYSAGPEADDFWKKYEEDKGNSFIEALDGFAAKHVFEFDKLHLDACDAAVLVLPAGKSGHLELGYVAGSGKPTFILLPEETDRWDVMYGFATKVVLGIPALLAAVQNTADEVEPWRIEEAALDVAVDECTGKVLHAASESERRALMSSFAPVDYSHAEFPTAPWPLDNRTYSYSPSGRYLVG